MHKIITTFTARTRILFGAQRLRANPSAKTIVYHSNHVHALPRIPTREPCMDFSHPRFAKSAPCFARAFEFLGATSLASSPRAHVVHRLNRTSVRFESGKLGIVPEFRN